MSYGALSLCIYFAVSVLVSGSALHRLLAELDAHAASVSMATLLAGGRMAMATAAIGVVLTLTTNMVVKAPTAWMTG